MYPFPNLPPALSREIFASLCRSLPPPADETQQARDARDTFAMAAIAALDPSDTAEAMLAVQVVTAECHARDCLRLATEHRHDLPIAFRCRSQAAALMRQMHQALRALRLAQAQRPSVAVNLPLEHPADLLPDLPPEPEPVTRKPMPNRVTQTPEPWSPRVTVPEDVAAAAATQLGMPRFAWAWVRPGFGALPATGDSSRLQRH